MVSLYSVPLIVASSISLIAGLFFNVLYHHLHSRHEEKIQYYLIFSLFAFVSGVFLAAFFILINSSDNLDYLDIANRVTVITAMFTVVLGLHFYVSFFEYDAPVYLKRCYTICTLFAVIALFPNEYFLAKELYPTSTYYTGLSFGPLFQLWGTGAILLLGYCVLILARIYQHQCKINQRVGIVLLLLLTTIFWAVTGVLDALTGIQVIDLPPLTWIGSFLVTFCIAWILVLHIDELYQERNQLNSHLMYDYLTKAFSRSYFEVRYSDALEAFSANRAPRLHLCMFDIDDFKSVNDQYGHSSGDELLKTVSTITQRFIGSEDCFARFGGDEFVILFSGQEEEQVVQRLKSIKEQVSRYTFGLPPYQFHATCSFGLTGVDTTHHFHKDLSNQLLSHADEALYKAKNTGKNTIAVSSLTAP
ncbi:GGDEF domain-containing protein [Vibrio cyclitrophicus]